MRTIQTEQAKSESLLLNILPRAIAEQLKAGSRTIAQSYEEATVLFADIEGFTQFASRISAQELVEVLNRLFTAFDELVEHHGLEKIKTIGDAYMAVAGVPEPSANHAERAADAALAMQVTLRRFSFGSNGAGLGLRIGLHSGPVVAGVIGTSKFSYDLWGDTVNIASRMESSGEKGRIQLSPATYNYLTSNYNCEPKGKIVVKGKGELESYWLLGKKSEA